MPIVKVNSFDMICSKAGINCAQTLAMRELESSVSLDNLIDATKKMLGTSYGVILRHKRIMDGHTDKLSEGAIESARLGLMELSHKDRASVLSHSRACVEEYDR